MKNGLISTLVENTGLSEKLISRIIASAPVRYKVYYIPKRNGGVREIAQPAREVKFLQRALVDAFISKLPVHEGATAYQTGASILKNASAHQGSGPILKLDFANFFPSIRSVDWENYCTSNGILDENDIKLSSNLLFRRGKGGLGLRLSIGAPSSPKISNILLYEFDKLVSAAVAKDKVIYTRYADDMTFSAPRTGHLQHVTKEVVHILANLKHPKLTLNKDKTTFVTKKYGRTVTGLTLSNDGRVTIGDSRRRKLRAAVHHAKIGMLSILEMHRLAGHLAFASSIEPEFVASLERKYGQQVMATIRAARSTSGAEKQD